jgi:hypothetical protein
MRASPKVAVPAEERPRGRHGRRIYAGPADAYQVIFSFALVALACTLPAASVEVQTME